MPVKKLVTKVWIDPGCIVCDACETACPEVFEVKEETCIIRPAALNAEFNKPLTDTIEQAAEECPVNVIKFETVETEVSEAEVAASKATVKPASTGAHGSELEAVTGAIKKKSSPDVPEGPVDPAIHALLKAVTSRGGRAGITTRSTNPIAALSNLGKKRFDELPPDARYARVLKAVQEVKKGSPEVDEVTRREFINKAALTVGWLSMGATIGTVSGPAFGRFMMPNVLEEPDPQIRIGSKDKYAAMALGEVNEDYKGVGIWIIRLDDRIAALSTVCTHLGCIPSWLPNDRKFKCPCHGSGFKPDGINFEGPAPRPLERLKIQEIDGMLVVNKSVKFLQEQGQWDQPESYFLV